MPKGQAPLPKKAGKNKDGKSFQRTIEVDGDAVDGSWKKGDKIGTRITTVKGPRENAYVGPKGTSQVTSWYVIPRTKDSRPIQTKGKK